MNIEKWEEAEHLPLVRRWCDARGVGWLDPSCVPPTGVVVNRTHVGFVYLTNSPIAILDQFISDPDASIGVADRAASMSALIATLTMVARDAGARFVTMSTSAQSILHAGELCGFECDGKDYSFAVRRL